LEIVEVVAGDGATAEPGSTIRVRYRAWLAEGSLVDDTERRGGPVELHLGEERTIAALEEGVLGMRVGGHRRLIAPSDLAYGPTGHGDTVPPYATLILDVELVSVG
jgi:FKBP-type peptidyl-prolyl cis-trans isomerase